MSNSLSRPTWSLGVPMPWPQASQPGLNAKVLAEIMGTGHPRPISTPGGFWSQPRPEVTQMASGGNSSWNHPGGLPRTQLLGQETQLKTKDAQLKDLVEKKRMESLAKMNQMTSSGGHSLPSNMNAATAGFYQPQISGYFGGQNLPTAAINHLGAIEAARNLFSGGFMPNHSRYGGNQPAPMGKK